MKQLSNLDTLFVSNETDTMMSHTGGLITLNPVDAPGFDFETFKAFVNERQSLVPYFKWKLKEVRLSMDRPYWVEDQDFHVDRHIHRIAVPSPGDRHALCELASYLFSQPLDRNKPLWEMWFIEGVEGNRCALLHKMHHCMMDGQGAQKLGELLVDFEPHPPPRKFDKTLPRESPGEPPTPKQAYFRGIRNLLRMPSKMAKDCWGVVSPEIIHAIKHNKKLNLKMPDVPRTCFNGTIGKQRGFVCQSVSINDIKRVKDHFGVTVNDVVLAITSRATRDYLKTQKDLPQESLQVGVPVSNRSEDDANFGNQTSLVNIPWSTDVANDRQRLKLIHESMNEAKEVMARSKSSPLDVLSDLPPLMIALLSQTLESVAEPPLLANLPVANVQGSPLPMYIAGAQIETMYPLSLLVPGMGLNITCVSYVDNIDFGFTYCPDLLKDPWLLPKNLEAALQRYVDMIPTKKKAPKKRPSARKNQGSSEQAPSKVTTS